METPASSDEPDVLPADRKLRRRLAFFLLLFTALGVVVIVALERHLETIVASSENNPEKAVREVFTLLRISTAVGGAGLLIFGLYFARFSLRVLSSGRFPPPGARVIRDTRIQKGSAAQRRGWTGIVLAVVLFALGLAVPWVPDLVIRPLVYRNADDAEGEATRPGSGQPPAPGNPELHAGFQPLLPGLPETGPGPSAARRSSTSS